MKQNIKLKKEKVERSRTQKMALIFSVLMLIMIIGPIFITAILNIGRYFAN